jgi:hypothetical protein
MVDGNLLLQTATSSEGPVQSAMHVRVIPWAIVSPDAGMCV